MNDMDGITTRPAPPELVQPCGYCTGDIMWIQLANETWRTFEPFEVYAASAPAQLLEFRGHMLHRGGYAVALSTLTAWPDWVLFTHVCTAYLLALEDTRSTVGHWGDAAPQDLARERFGSVSEVAREMPLTPSQKRRRDAKGVVRGRGEARKD